jgi:AcrR family transcriptional regulator
MPSPLEKARQEPDSMKGRILASARTLFGEYGFHGVTTRMIAKTVGIDISTLHYHWGDKRGLYEAVVADLNAEIGARLKQIDHQVRGRPLPERLAVAIDVMCDHLFAHPEASNLILQSYFTKTRPEAGLDAGMTAHVANIAIAMGLALDRRNVSPQANARVLAVWNAVTNFTSGEALFRPMLAVDHERYVEVVKETLKFILIPAFARPSDPVDRTDGASHPGGPDQG